MDHLDESPAAMDQQLTKLLHQHRRDLMFELRRLSHKEKVVTQHQEHFQTLLDAVVQQHVQRLYSTDCPDEDDDYEEEEDIKKPEALAEPEGEQSVATATEEEQPVATETEEEQPVATETEEDAEMPVAVEAEAVEAPRDPVDNRPPEIRNEMQHLVAQRPVTHLLRGEFRSLLERAVSDSTDRLIRLQRPRATPRRPVDSSTTESGPAHRDQEVSRHRAHGTGHARHGGNAGTGTRVRQGIRTIEPQEVNLLNQMERIQQEEIVLEVEEIMHHQVVSAILASEFRSALEQHMEDRLQRAGGSGEQVEQFVRGLAHRRPRDHRASHTRHGASSLDGAEVTGLKADVRALTRTVAELERLVKLSFDLHLDNQRVLRQEMAAVSHAVNAQQHQGIASVGTTGPMQGGTCVVCHTCPSDATFYSCGHMCTCCQCAHDLHARPNPVCPICRAPVKDIIRVFHV
eukprot:scpid52815/ scgid1647/ E3 ubiquitin-protein ligase NEURL1B; Neuralized-like protein 1B; Neuralized-like protein 3